MRRDARPGTNGTDRFASLAMARGGCVVVGGTTARDDGTRDALFGRVMFDRVGGTAVLSRNGTLKIRGTLGPDALRTNLGPVGAGGAQDLLVRINERPAQAFNLASVRRIVVSAGNGNDRVLLWSDVADDNGLPIRAGGKPALIEAE